MKSTQNRQVMLVIAIILSFSTMGIAGQAGRGVPAQGSTAQGAPAQQAGAPGGGRGGRGGAAGTGGAIEFYNYDTTASAGIAIPDSKPIETHQKITISGEALAYTAYAGYMPLRNATSGQSEAHLFFTYYAREGAGDPSTRPLLFFLGGAPGSAASWQELGGFGPKRLAWPEDRSAMQPPYRWTENPNTLLGQADMVFANPVGTAFSRPDQPAKGPNFWNTAADIASLAEFVRSFLNTYDRRNSPLFLAGEDFGTGRAAGLANYLTERQVPIQGVILLSVTPAADAVAGDARYMTLLPSMAVAAWYHKKLAPDLQSMTAEQVAEQARQFASREYLHALYKGDRAAPEEQAKAVANLARLTGLSKAFIVNNDLRIGLDRFNGELLRDQRRALSSSDARIAGFVPLSSGGRGGFGGPAASAIDYNQTGLAGGFLTACETYLRRELAFPNSTNSIFYLSSGGIGAFASTGNDDASLSAAFARNPRLRLFVAANYFDLNAPFYATEFTLAHLSVSPEVRAHNISVNHFEAGQMAYVDNKALAKLRADLVRFINETLSIPRQ